MCARIQFCNCLQPYGEEVAELHPKDKGRMQHLKVGVL